MSRAQHRVPALCLVLALVACGGDARRSRHDESAPAAESAPTPEPPVDLDAFVEAARVVGREICPETPGIFDVNACEFELTYDRGSGLADLRWNVRSAHPEVRSHMAPLVVEERGTLGPGAPWKAPCSVRDLGEPGEIAKLAMRCSGPLVDEQSMDRLLASVDLEGGPWSLARALERASSIACWFDDGAHMFWCYAILESGFDLDSLPGTHDFEEPLIVQRGVPPLDGHIPGAEARRVVVIADPEHRVMRVSAWPEEGHDHLLVRGSNPNLRAGASSGER